MFLYTHTLTHTHTHTQLHLFASCFHMMGVAFKVARQKTQNKKLIMLQHKNGDSKCETQKVQNERERERERNGGREREEISILGQPVPASVMSPTLSLMAAPYVSAILDR